MVVVAVAVVVVLVPADVDAEEAFMSNSPIVAGGGGISDPPAPSGPINGEAGASGRFPILLRDMEVMTLLRLDCVKLFKSHTLTTIKNMGGYYIHITYTKRNMTKL